MNYRKAISLREIAAIKELNGVPKQMAMMYGPEPLYQPTSQKKFAALDYYFQILESLLRQDALPTDGHIWHNDLHHDNIFVDPEELKVLGIIDWQSVQIAPYSTIRSTLVFLTTTALTLEKILDARQCLKVSNHCKARKKPRQ